VIEETGECNRQSDKQKRRRMELEPIRRMGLRVSELYLKDSTQPQIAMI